MHIICMPILACFEVSFSMCSRFPTAPGTALQVAALSGRPSFTTVVFSMPVQLWSPERPTWLGRHTTRTPRTP